MLKTFNSFLPRDTEQVLSLRASISHLHPAVTAEASLCEGLWGLLQDSVCLLSLDSCRATCTAGELLCHCFPTRLPGLVSMVQEDF